MGKHGPCCHCGVTSTPLWRNGPPEKPVLCNACGSRWRTKGTLVNYTPLHSRAEPDEFEDYRVSKVKTISIKNKEAKVLKRKFDQDISEYGLVPPDYNSGFRRGFDEDISNRSSSGSAISNSESCAQYGNADASDLTGPSQPVVWDSMVPSRKRTCITRTKPSPIEKLTQDLYKIWHQLQSSCLSGFSDEDLLLETGKPMESVEIGHGSVLIRHPDSIAREEESEASSLSINQKQKPFVNSRPTNFPVVMEDKGVNSLDRGIDKIKKPPNQGAEQERIRRDKDQLEKLQLLAHHNSPLCHIDLQEVLNIDNFANHLTNEEQKQLLKFLPSVDTLEAPLSLKSMFDSPQFNESILSFQKLLADGILDNSFTGVSSEDCKLLKKLILCNSSRSKWVEQYNKLKDLKGKNSIDDSEVVGGFNSFATDNSSTIKRLRDGQHQKFAGSKVLMKSPRKIIMKSNYDQKELTDKNALFLTSKSVVSSQNDNGPSLAFGYSQHYGAESCDQDLLLDVPSNSSFPQAELLRPFPSFGAEASTSSSSVYPDTVRP